MSGLTWCVRPFERSSGASALTHGDRWTTDAELEALASQFGAVEQVKFFEDKVNGKSKVRCPLSCHAVLR